MDIKKISNSITIFVIKRLIEIVGFIISFVGILLLLALITHSPQDPNFIFPSDTKINNLLGFYGSYTSDLFFQSVGLISFMISISFIFIGINVFKNKDIFFIIESLFFITLYSLIGSLFFSFYYNTSFNLYINGNGGFIGQYLNNKYD